MNSLRSNSISCRFACLAYATQESKKIPIIVHPINTSSCGMFSRSLATKKIWSTVRLRACSLRLSKNVFEESSDVVTREKESNPQNIPHEEVFRGMQILWIDIESRIASAIWATKYEMLFERSEFIEWFEEFVYRPPSQDVLGITFFFDQLAN